LLDRLLTESVATLSAAGVIDLDEVCRTGGGAGIGGSGFVPTQEKAAQGTQEGQATDREAQAGGKRRPGRKHRRIRAARERAAHEREARVAAALR